MGAVRFSHITKRFNNSSQNLFTDLSLSIDKQQLLCVLGPSGCGKSTLLRLIAGFEQPSAGKVLIEDQFHNKVGFVFQESHLLPWRTLKENVALPLEIKNKSGNIDETLQLVGLKQYQDYKPAELSGGMKMRTSIARALVDDVSLLLMDEPFSALDEPTRQDLQVELCRLQRSRQLTTVFVTHSLSEAAFLADRIVILNRQATVVEDFKTNGPEVRPASYRTSDEYFKNLKQLTEVFEAKARTK